MFIPKWCLPHQWWNTSGPIPIYESQWSSEHIRFPVKTPMPKKKTSLCNMWFFDLGLSLWQEGIPLEYVMMWCKQLHSITENKQKKYVAPSSPWRIMTTPHPKKNNSSFQVFWFSLVFGEKKSIPCEKQPTTPCTFQIARPCPFLELLGHPLPIFRGSSKVKGDTGWCNDSLFQYWSANKTL